MSSTTISEVSIVDEGEISDIVAGEISDRVARVVSDKVVTAGPGRQKFVSDSVILEVTRLSGEQNFAGNSVVSRDLIEMILLLLELCVIYAAILA
jgi:hypothetical protein